MLHSPGFLKIVNDTRPLVKEVALEEARRRLEQNPQAILLDVREDKEWDKGHAVRAMHLGKGVLERDIEERISNKQTEILMYCGGGFRSALTCDAAQKLGYRNVHSLIGGHKGMVAAGWPMTQ